MKREWQAIFQTNGIEYAEALSYADVTETKPHIREREGMEAKSVLIFLVPYYAGETENLSRYAASLDYHLVIGALTERLIAALTAAFPGHVFRGYGDHSPIDERGAALIAGLGFAGDNGLLLNETYGSYVFIGDILTDVSPEDLGAISPQPVRTCEHCGRCKAACPTGILRGEGTDCLSAITQRKGELTDAEIDLMKRVHTVWGCDECQCHCPHNRAPKPTPIPFFYEDRIPRLTSALLEAMDDEAFARRAFAWRKRETVARNLRALGE